MAEPTKDPHTDHGLIHSLYDAVTGAFTKTPPPKPAYNGNANDVPLGTGLADKGAGLIRNRKSQIDQAVEDAGG
jgi:hypothetical protein